MLHMTKNVKIALQCICVTAAFRFLLSLCSSCNLCYRKPTAAARDKMVESRDSPSTSDLEVLNEENSAGVMGALKQRMMGSAAGLVLTFASSKCDEQALVRDCHKAESEGSKYNSKLWPLHLPVYNMFQACTRLKKAHDRTFNHAFLQSLAEADAIRRQKCTLTRVHRLFVMSTGRRFVKPLPEGVSYA